MKVIYIGSLKEGETGCDLITKMKNNNMEIFHVKNPEQIVYNIYKKKVMYNNINLAEFDAILVRATNNKQKEVALLVKVLDSLGVFQIDPVERFDSNMNGKIGTSVTRALSKIGPNTYFSFDNLTALKREIKYPVVCKPKNGKKCIGRELINNEEELDTYLSSNKIEDTIIQDKIDILDEWRVLCYYKDDSSCNIIGIINKNKILGQKNAKKRANVKLEDKNKLKYFVSSFSKKGLIGFDIANTSDGFVIIEENRSPEWMSMQKYLKKDISSEVINIIENDFLNFKNK